MSASHNSLLNVGVCYLLCQYSKFSLGFIFFSNFEAIASPLNLDSSWKPSYSTVSCCLMHGPQRIY